MAGEADHLQGSDTLYLGELFPSPPGLDDLRPLGFGLHIVEGGDVEVVGAEFIEDPLELGFRLVGGARLELHRDDHVLAPIAHRRDGARKPVGFPAPVEIVQAAFDGIFDVFGTQVRIAPGGQPQAAYGRQVVA